MKFNVINSDNVIQFVYMNAIKVFNGMEDIKNEPYNRLRSTDFTNEKMINLCIERKDKYEKRTFNFYFPVDGKCTSEYISEFKNVFIDRNPICESDVFKIAHKVYSNFYFNVVGFRDNLPDIIDENDYYEILECVTNYLDDKFVYMERQLKFEQSLNPDVLNPKLIKLKIFEYLMNTLINKIRILIDIKEIKEKLETKGDLIDLNL